PTLLLGQLIESLLKLWQLLQELPCPRLKEVGEPAHESLCAFGLECFLYEADASDDLLDCDRAKDTNRQNTKREHQKGKKGGGKDTSASKSFARRFVPRRKRAREDRGEKKWTRKRCNDRAKQPSGRDRQTDEDNVGDAIWIAHPKDTLVDSITT